MDQILYRGDEFFAVDGKFLCPRLFFYDSGLLLPDVSLTHEGISSDPFCRSGRRRRENNR